MKPIDVKPENMHRTELDVSHKSVFLAGNCWVARSQERRERRQASGHFRRHSLSARHGGTARQDEPVAVRLAFAPFALSPTCPTPPGAHSNSKPLCALAVTSSTRGRRRRAAPACNEPPPRQPTRRPIDTPSPLAQRGAAGLE